MSIKARAEFVVLTKITDSQLLKISCTAPKPKPVRRQAGGKPWYSSIPHHVQALTLFSSSVQIKSTLAAVDVEIKGTHLAFKVNSGFVKYRPDAIARCSVCKKT
jgi:hypothetical protein